MISPHPAQALVAPSPGVTISIERLRCLLLWFTGACGAIVFVEPSPYEAASFLTIAAFMLGGLVLRPALLPFAILLVLINIGYGISASALLAEQGVLAWVLTSWYLAVTALFFAAMLGGNTEARLAALIRGCLIAGVIASLAAIIGYARVYPAANEYLLLHERARGTFKDPNVLGAFLVFPTLLALQRVISGGLRKAAGGAALLVLFAAAILLSFSRAAWGQAMIASVIVLFLTMITAHSPAQRLRIVLLGAAGIAVLAGFVTALLSIDTVAEMFQQRASLRQSYDVGEQGRFGRHILGAILALDVPFGIGPLQFSKYFPEDPHSSYLNAFMSGGWLSGACYPALVVLSVAVGFRSVLLATPWRQAMIAVYAGYVGVAIESLVIDSDHWRHGFLLLGVLWGLIAATWSYGARHGGRQER
jgi:hypothetical protein